MFSPDKTFLALIDAQEKLMAAMFNPAEVSENLVLLVKGLQALDVPILISEQNPQGLGPTISPLRNLFQNNHPIKKISFSCCGEEAYIKSLRGLDRRQALVCGIESHVCVYQTVVDLTAMGYEVQVVSDCVSSRKKENKEIGLERCREKGASITSVETILFELLRRAEGSAFKKILALVK